MSHWKKTYAKVLEGNSDANIPFGDLCVLLQRLGYVAKQNGTSHIVFRKAGHDLITLQNAGGKAKSYQVRQVREQLTKS